VRTGEFHERSEPVAKEAWLQHPCVRVAATLILLLAINLWKGPPYWILWVLLGWGIGLFAHWFFVLGPGADKTEKG
jgi:2TM domain-containing protein